MVFGETTSAEIETAAREIVDAAFKVHSELGAGLLESVYQSCMVHELDKRGLRVGSQVPVPIIYDGVRLDADLRLDLLVNDLVVVQLKAVERLIPLHDAQLMTYLKLSRKRLGILINFNTRLIKDGIKRIVL